MLEVYWFDDVNLPSEKADYLSCSFELLPVFSLPELVFGVKQGYE